MSQPPPLPDSGIQPVDLRAAVAAGVLSEAQAARLTGLAAARRGARADLTPEDEPFELFKGFNEVFIVVGLVILATGWLGVSGFGLAASAAQGVTNPVMRIGLTGVAGAVLIWLLSEYFIRRRRMVAPAITLAIFWAVNAVGTIAAWIAEPFMLAQGDVTSLAAPLALATGLVALHWWRFRVPFALALVALGLFATAILVTSRSAGIPRSWAALFDMSAQGPFAWVTLALGVLVFVAAMAFDMSDPHRVTRRAVNGFWLHVVAAPMLVNTIALTLLSRQDGAGQVLLAIFLLVIAVVAIIIDRRSFLIAGVGYSVALAGTLFGVGGSAATILALGVTLVLLGAFWERVRAVLLRALAGVLPLGRLPPATL